MSDTQEVQTEQPIAENEEVAQPSTLPSDVDAQQELESKLDFSLTDSVKEKFLTKDGKLLGKYESLEQLAEAHKYLQDKHAMYVEDTKNQEKEITEGIEQDQKAIQQQETIMSLLPDFMANDMELTPEIEQKIVETGIDVRDLKLDALELKNKVNHIYDLVGGKENWENTKAYLADKISEEEYKKINADLVSSNSDYTVLGMYNMYKQSLDGNTPVDRIRGESTAKSPEGYSSRAEVFKDRQYLQTPAGRKDQNAQAKYRDKLARTDLSKLGIRA